MFLPAMVALYSLDEYGGLRFQDAASRRSRGLTNGLLKVFAARNSARVADLREVESTGLPAGTFYTGMDRATTDIVTGWLTPLGGAKGLPVPAFKADALNPWMAALDADYVVFLKFKGAYETEARRKANVAVTLVGGTYVYARRIATLAVVNLRDGHILQIEGERFDDLQSAEEIRSILDKLVSPLQQ